MTYSPDNEIILGIDPGTVVTGYGVISVQEGRLTAIDFGCIRPPRNHKLTDRYLIIFQAIEELVLKFKPTSLSVETQFVGKNVASAMKLGMARAAALLAARRLDVKVFQYAPSRAKLAVVGNGQASKVQVQHMVKHLLALSQIPEPEDAADALALAVCHAQAKRQRTLLGEEI